jgi:hypothetical protein
MKNKRHVIGVGFPWYGNTFNSKGTKKTNHGLGSLTLYKTKDKERVCENDIVMLNPNRTYFLKRYRLILEEIE